MIYPSQSWWRKTCWHTQAWQVAFICLALLVIGAGSRALAQTPSPAPAPTPQAGTPDAAAPAPSLFAPPISSQERLLAPVPEAFGWSNREVRPNPLLESLLDLREGAPALFISTSLTEEYSDNFERDEVDRRDEFLTRLSLGTVYRQERGRAFISLANSLSGSYEARAENFDIAFVNLALNAGYRLPRLSLALNESFVRDEESAGDASANLRSSGRRNFLRNRVGPQIQYQLSRTTSANLGYTHTLVTGEEQEARHSHAVNTGLQHRFTTNLQGTMSYAFTTTLGGNADDRRSHRATADLQYGIGRLTSTFLSAFGSLSNQSGAGDDSRTYGATVGVRRTITPLVSITLAVGPTVFRRANENERLLLNWQASLDGALPLFRSRQTSLTLSANQDVQDTTDQVDSFGLVLRQSVGVALNHAASRRLRATLFADYARTEVLEFIGGATDEDMAGRTDNFWSAGARASYTLTRILSLTASYRYQRRSSNRSGNDFEENRFSITLSAGFPVF